MPTFVDGAGRHETQGNPGEREPADSAAIDWWNWIHDLRHAGITWAAPTGASTEELMARMGHANSEAALRYQHATSERDQAITAALCRLVLPPS